MASFYRVPGCCSEPQQGVDILRLPPAPREPYSKQFPELKGLHDLVQVVREECLASSKRQEMVLSRLMEQHEAMHEKLSHHLAPPPEGEEEELAVSARSIPAATAKPAVPDVSKSSPQEQKKDVQEQSPAPAQEKAAKVVVKPVQSSGIRDTLRELVRSRAFDGIMGILICLNVVMMFVELEKTGHDFAVRLQLKAETGTWDGADVVFRGIEHVFNSVFFLELLCRFVVDFCGSIRSPAILFDTFIVGTSAVDYVFKYILSSSGGANVNFLRMARLIKLVKLFRAFKAAAVFSELRILIKTLLSSIMALTWSGVLLSFIMLFSGLVMAQLVSSVIDDEQRDFEQRKWSYEHYGSGSRAFYTLFEATLSGGWPNYARPLIEGVSHWYAIFWLLYVLIVVFAVMRVVTALFLQNTLKMANADDELMLMDKMKRKEAYITKLRAFLCDSDEDGNGHMDLGELEGLLERPDILSWLGVIGLESHEVVGLFHVLDDGHGEITHEELLGGMMKLSGGVRAIDSVLMQRDMKRTIRKLDHISNLIARIG